MYELEIVHESDKRVKTKSQKDLEANSYVCESFRRQTGRGGDGDFLAHPILNRVKLTAC